MTTPTAAELSELADAPTPNTETGSLNYQKFARAVLAKWGTPAPVGVEPVAWAFQHADGTWHDPSLTEHSAGMKGLVPADQVLAMGRVPLNSEQRRALLDSVDHFNFPEDLIQATEEKHGIKQGGQHGTE